MRKLMLLGLLGVLLQASVLAQHPAVPFQSKGQYRDALIDASERVVYVSVYDRGEVWVVDPRTGERLERIATGKGAADLTWSADGSEIAVLNRLASTVSIIKKGSTEVSATLEVGQGAASIAALPGGGYAVANSFDDSLSLIQSDATVVDATDVPEVPVLVAVAGDTLAVVGRTADTIHLTNSTATAKARVIPLRSRPTSLAGVGEDTFLVGASEGLYVVKGGTAQAVAGVDEAVRSVQVVDGAVRVVTATQVHHLDSALTVSQSKALSASVLQVIASPALEVSLAPGTKQGSAQVLDMVAWGAPRTPTMELVVAQDTPKEAPAPAPQDDAIVIVEAEDADAAPMAEEAAPEAAADDEAIILVENAAPVAPAEEADPAASDTATTQATGYPQGVREYPLRTGEVRAPEFDRPAASPLNELDKRTIADALAQPTQFGSEESGFQAPDWSQPLRDIRADNTKFTKNLIDMDLTGNVSLNLGSMLFQADRFRTEDEKTKYAAMGNVLIAQENSRMTADEFYYWLPEHADAQGSAFAPALTEQERSRQQLSRGRLQAKNLYLDEPTREMHAESVDYDFSSSSGTMLHTHGLAGIYYFGAEELQMMGEDHIIGKDVWITTCDHNPPHYRIRLKDAEFKDGQLAGGSSMRMELFQKGTPFFLPKWRSRGAGSGGWNIDFDSGREAELGSYVNVGQRFEVSPDFAIGPRLFVTAKEGVGLGIDADYNFMENPASRLYRTKGTFNALGTTKDRGYVEWKHRWEPNPDLVVRAQAEQWGDRAFVKDFYYDSYRNRTTPRTFISTTYRQPTYVATGTARVNTHGWVRETERLPEGTYHLMDRPIGKGLYLSFDTLTGYYDREPDGHHSARSVNVARLSYDWDPAPWMSVTPFYEADVAWYENDLRGDSNTRFSHNMGVTLQSRLHKTYDGFWGFDQFKHIVLPSMTYTYRPDSSMSFSETPRFDNYDNTIGQSRVETKLDNVFYGRDAATGEIWQVGRISLYQGNDFWNEVSKAEAYEIEIDIRPRPWWAFQLAGERHVYDDEYDLDAPFVFRQRLLQFYENLFGHPYDLDEHSRWNARFGDYNRVLSQFYYDKTPHGGKWSARVGFNYTETQSRVFNREMLYGAGYRINDKWGLSFEHRYDFEAGELRTQTYELRRRLHCWETAIRVRDRESGIDVDLEFNIVAFPGSRLKL